MLWKSSLLCRKWLRRDVPLGISYIQHRCGLFQIKSIPQLPEWRGLAVPFWLSLAVIGKPQMSRQNIETYDRYLGGQRYYFQACWVSFCLPVLSRRTELHIPVSPYHCSFNSTTVIALIQCHCCVWLVSWLVGCLIQTGRAFSHVDY